MAHDWWDQYSRASRDLEDARATIVRMEREHEEALSVARVDVREAQSLAKIARCETLDVTEQVRLDAFHTTVRLGIVLTSATIIAVCALVG